MDRLKFRLATFAYTLFMLGLCSMLFAQRPGEVTRGGAPEPEPLAQLNLPLPGSDANPISSWGEVVGMITAVTLLGGLAQWLVAKIIVLPEIVKEREALQIWAKQEFPARVHFDSHMKDDAHFQKDTDDKLLRLSEIQEKDHDRLEEIHGDVRLIKNKVGI